MIIMDNQIGYKTTFWELVSKQPISIPTLQRDYIYGAGTEKTETVLSNMLSTFKTALDSVTQNPNERKEALPTNPVECVQSLTQNCC